MGSSGNPLPGLPDYSGFTDTTEVDTLKKRVASLSDQLNKLITELGDKSKLLKEKQSEYAGCHWHGGVEHLLGAKEGWICADGGKKQWYIDQLKSDIQALQKRVPEITNEIKDTQGKIDQTKALLAVALANLQTQADVNISTEDKIKEQQSVTSGKIKTYLTVGIAGLMIFGGLYGGWYFIKKGMKA